MTTEEKAKAYDEAIKVAKNELKQDLHESGIWAIKRIFPELAESEDERIRKWLVQYIKDTHPILNYWNGAPTIYDVLAWLEKQKEPQNKSMAHEDCSWTGILTSPLCKDKNLDDIAQEYVEGVKEYNPMPDWNLIHTAVCYGYHLAEQKEQKPRLIGEDSVEKTARQMYETGQTIKEQKPAEWSEKHIAGIFEKVGLAKIVREQGNDDLTNALQDAMLELSKVGNIEWSEEDEEMLEYIIGDVNDAKQLYTTKEAKDMADKEIAWLKSLPLNLKKKNEDVAKLCSNEWSEEDEEMLNRIIETLSLPPIYDTKACAKMVAWLKSLRPQPQMLEDWTKEDEELLKDVLGCITLVQTYKACGDLEEFKMGHTGEELRSFVRSLKSRPRKQPHWKPSEEQMEALKKNNTPFQFRLRRRKKKSVGISLRTTQETNRLIKEGNESVTKCNKLKMVSPKDGKRYKP